MHFVIGSQQHAALEHFGKRGCFTLLVVKCVCL